MYELFKPSQDPYEVGAPNTPFSQVRTLRPERLVGAPRTHGQEVEVCQTPELGYHGCLWSCGGGKGPQGLGGRQVGEGSTPNSLRVLGKFQTGQATDRSIKSKEIELLILKFPTKKTPGSDGFACKFHQTCKEELIPIFHQLLQKIEERGHSPSHSMKPGLP